jgi:hypothetical protein
MAEHDDMADAEYLHREFERREDAVAHAVRCERRHQISDVAHDEQLARMGIEDHLRRHPGIAAADDHGVRRLAPPGELAIAVALGRHPPDPKIVIALHQAQREKRHVRHEISSGGIGRDVCDEAPDGSSVRPHHAGPT